VSGCRPGPHAPYCCQKELHRLLHRLPGGSADGHRCVNLGYQPGPVALTIDQAAGNIMLEVLDRPKRNQASLAFGPKLYLPHAAVLQSLNGDPHASAQEAIDRAWARWAHLAPKEMAANGGTAIEQAGQALQVNKVEAREAIATIKGKAGAADAWRWVHRRLQEILADRGRVPPGFRTWAHWTKVVKRRLDGFAEQQALTSGTASAIQQSLMDAEHFWAGAEHWA
jgi:hypothetical protein